MRLMSDASTWRGPELNQDANASAQGLKKQVPGEPDPCKSQHGLGASKYSVRPSIAMSRCEHLRSFDEAAADSPQNAHPRHNNRAG
jgi:hypothetical protein